MSPPTPIRRVMQVHTRYRQAGGEDQVVAAERRLLEAAGVEVEQVLFDNTDLRDSRSFAGDVRLAMNAVWSRSSERRVRAAIAARKPQVMHVHNTFAAASPSVYAAAHASSVPVIQTLHNYRFVCPAATAFRDGHPCTDCVGRRVPWPAVIHSCVRGSRAQSIVAATTLGAHRAVGTFDRRIDTFVALTSFQRQLMVDGWLPGNRIVTIPNFLEPDPGSGGEQRSGILYVGRLSQEKGIATLLQAAALNPGQTRIAGAGPLAAAVQEAAGRGSVEYLGALDSPSVIGEVRAAIAVVVPSIWFEGFPMVVLEAYASGTPVIASAIGSLGAVVEDGVTGLLAAPGDAAHLAERVQWAIAHPEKMRRLGANARRRFEAEFRGPTHLAALLDVYGTAMGRSPRQASA